MNDINKVDTLSDNNKFKYKLKSLYYSIMICIIVLIPIILFMGFWIKKDIDNSRTDYIKLLDNGLKNLSGRVDNYLSYFILSLQTLEKETISDQVNIEKFQQETTAMHHVMGQWAFFSVYNVQSSSFSTENRLSEYPINMDRFVGAINDAVRTKEIYFQVLFNKDDRHLIVINVPVSRNGTVRYVLSGALLLDGIQKIVDPVAYQPVQKDKFSVVSLILTKDGQYIAHFPEDHNFTGEFAPGFPKKNLTHGKLTELINSGKQSSQYIKRLDGADLYVGYHISSLTKWLTVAVKKEDNFHFLWNSIWAIITSGIVVLILIGISGTLLNYRFLQRQLEMQKVASFKATVDLKNELIKTTEKNLDIQKELTSQKEMLLRETYHRIKNNLMAIQSLMVLSAKNLPAEQRAPFNTAVRRLNAMSRVHTMLYMSSDISAIDFKEYLESIVDDMSFFVSDDESSIQFEMDIPEKVDISSKKAVTLAFITIEIIANAFKYAFPGNSGGIIYISLKKEGNTGILCISDNGVGFPEVRTIDTSKKSMGMKIIMNLIEQIEGSITLPVAGKSDYKLSFPLT